MRKRIEVEIMHRMLERVTSRKVDIGLSDAGVECLRLQVQVLEWVLNAKSEAEFHATVVSIMEQAKGRGVNLFS